MQTWQLFGLASAVAILVILWPAARRIGGSGAPILRWALIWVAAIGAVMVAFELVLAPMGVGLR